MKVDGTTGAALWTEAVHKTSDIEFACGVTTDLSGNVFTFGWLKSKTTMIRLSLPDW